MDKIHKVLKRMSYLTSVLDSISTLEELASADSKFDRKTLTDIGTYTFQHFAHNPDTVLQTAAILISTVVEIWGKELVQKPTMTGMDHDHLISGTLCQRRRITI